MTDKSSNDDAPNLLSRIDNTEEEDIYAQLDRLDESLNNELEDLKRIMVLSQESSTIKEGDAANENDKPHDIDATDGNCSNNDDEIDAQSPQLQQPADQEEEVGSTHTAIITGKSKANNRRQRNSSQRGKRNNIRDSNNCKQQTPTISSKRNNRNDRKQQQGSRAKTQVDVVNKVEKNDDAVSSSTAKRAGLSSDVKKNADSSSASKMRAESLSVANKNADSSSTPLKTQPKRMEGRGRGFRRRQATLRHQEQQAKQPNENNEANNNEATTTTKTPPAEGGEGKGRRARARRSRIRREQQKINDEGNNAVPEPRKKKDNLSIEQKQRIIDSLNQGRNNFLSR